MAAEWEAALGMELGMGAHYHHAQPASAAAASQMNHHAAFSHSHSQPQHYHFYAPLVWTQATTICASTRCSTSRISSHLGAHDFLISEEK